MWQAAMVKTSEDGTAGQLLYTLLRRIQIAFTKRRDLKSPSCHAEGMVKGLFRRKKYCRVLGRKMHLSRMTKHLSATLPMAAQHASVLGAFDQAHGLTA